MLLHRVARKVSTTASTHGAHHFKQCGRAFGVARVIIRTTFGLAFVAAGTALYDHFSGTGKALITRVEHLESELKTRPPRLE
eukprot:CAMPEP_0206035442 /NCGR_PEP_ID=MMETSP1466-20131121/2079_1 /ASSEMBLY_ACC=CAM_ASM_001126 /TAXON_ID=44452 /ORGANISM="Pavlova gyrans, Strain CCMP608" /LENGTH=81 /DNA_ID=CAMNT_0053409825 /DNA_START=94 /DNA_END=339 /DNA_ORIENTATION=-